MGHVVLFCVCYSFVDFGFWVGLVCLKGISLEIWFGVLILLFCLVGFEIWRFGHFQDFGDCC